MSSESPPLPLSPSPTLRFWLGGAAAAVAIGWVGAKLNASGAAPLGLLPLGLGIALGVALVGLAAMMHARCSKRHVLATIACGILLVAAEHAWLYRDYRQQWWNDRAREPALAIFRPETSPLSPAAYFKREIEFSPRVLVLWAVDAVLIVSSAVGVVLVWRRRIK